MKRSLILITIALTFISAASAHEVKTDQSMSILLHMEPQDSPVIREPAQLIFAFTDSRSKFEFKSCDCRVSIKQGGTVISQNKLEKEEPLYGSNVASLDFVFPKKGIYRIELTGNPIQPEQFDAFSVFYDVRIEREDISQNPVNPLLGIKGGTNSQYYIYALGLIGAIVILMLGFGKIKINFKFMKKFKSLFVFVLLVLFALPAYGHVVVGPNKVGLGAFQTFTMSVPSEREASTIELRLVLPDGLEHVTPTVKPGWNVEVLVHQLPSGDHPYEIKWTGGKIAGHFRDDFSFSAKVPASETVLNWKAYQKYSDGSVVSWDLDATAEQPKKDDGSPDFSQVGPASQTKIVDDLSATANMGDSVNMALTVSAIMIAVASLVVSMKRKK